MDCRIELIFIPVSDVDRARDFYVNQAGFVLDHDMRVDENTRFVQITPPGSACSIAFGEGIHEGSPGTFNNIQVVVDSAAAAHAELTAAGVEPSPLNPQPWGIFTTFDDPDGNTWTIQELPAR